jgi:hypothetical protein
MCSFVGASTQARFKTLAIANSPPHHYQAKYLLGRAPPQLNDRLRFS